MFPNCMYSRAFRYFSIGSVLCSSSAGALRSFPYKRQTLIPRSLQVCGIAAFVAATMVRGFSFVNAARFTASFVRVCIGLCWAASSCIVRLSVSAVFSTGPLSRGQGCFGQLVFERAWEPASLFRSSFRASASDLRSSFRAANSGESSASLVLRTPFSGATRPSASSLTNWAA